MNPPLKRRKKSDNRQRQQVLRCRVTETEAAEIAARAEALGVSMPALMRAAALGIEPPRSNKRIPGVTLIELAHLRGHLGKIGSNLNQLARIANTTGALREGPRVMDTLIDLRQLLGLIAETLP